MGKTSRTESDQVLQLDISTLINNLRWAFSRTKADAPQPLTLQSQYVVALAEIAKFLERRPGIEKSIPRKFVELADAVRALRHGTVADALRPANVGGRGPDGYVVWAGRAEVCKALECLHKSGQSVPAAAKYIAKSYPVFSRLKRNDKDALDKAILSWRKHINNGTAPTADDIISHERKFFEGCGELNSKQMLELGESILRQAAQQTECAAI